MSGWIGAWGTTATVTNLTVTGSQVISVNTSTDALRITQTGSGNALLVEDSANPDSSPFVVNADGRVRRGTTAAIGFQTALGNIYNNSGITNTGNAANDGSLINAVFNPTGTAFGAALCLARSAGTTVGDYTVLPSGNAVGQISFNASDSAKFIEAAAIYAFVDGTPGLNDMPGRLVFSTTADGAASPTEKMRIDNAGNIYATSGTTAMTSGFFYIPAAAGAPSGVPTAVSGRVPMYYDTTNNNFYVYNGAWKKVLLG